MDSLSETCIHIICVERESRRIVGVLVGVLGVLLVVCAMCVPTLEVE